MADQESFRQGTMIGITADGETRIIKVNDDGELIINLEAATVNIGDVDVLSLPELPTGTKIIGKVGIDQTADGTTNKVQARNSAHDDLQTNANLQVNNADNSVSNPAFVAVTGSKAQEYEALTIDATAGGIACTTVKVGTCTKAFMRLETAQIRYTVDGTAPTAAVGMLLEVGEILKLDSAEDIAAFRGFRTGATSGSLRCFYSL